MRIIGVGGLAQSAQALPGFLRYDQIVCQAPRHGHRFGDRVEAVCEVLKKQPEKVLLVGSSAGGKAALVAASRYRHKVAGILLIAPAPFEKFPQSILCSALMLGYLWPIYIGEIFKIKEDDYKKIALGGPIADEKIHDLIRGRLNVSGFECMDLIQNRGVKKFDPSNLADVPILMIVGSSDGWVRPSAQYRLQKMLEKAKARIEVIEVRGAGHMPCHIQDDGLEREIYGWVENVT